MAETTAKTIAKKTATKTPVASAKPTATKPAAPVTAVIVKPVAKKSAAVKKLAVAKASATKPAAKSKAMIVSGEQRYRMVAEAAYYRAESNQFKSDPLRDWIEAESDIAALLSGSK